MAALIFILLLIPAFVQAQARALPPPPQTDFVQKLDAPLPLDLQFTDDRGRQVRLGEYFDRRPVVLVLGYYHCPNLCGTLMEGVLPVLAQGNLPADAYRVVEVSIDPGEDAALAARRKVSYEPMFGRRGGELHLLTGSAPAIARLAKDAGFHYAYDAGLRQYVHPAGFLIATPQGRISHYFMGVRFEPRDVRLALVDASAGRIGSPADRLLLLCAHYDPRTGRYTVTVMAVVRIVCLLVLTLLAVWIWRHRAERDARR
jgi:protein SCO1/2